MDNFVFQWLHWLRKYKPECCILGVPVSGTQLEPSSLDCWHTQPSAIHRPLGSSQIQPPELKQIMLYVYLLELVYLHKLSTGIILIKHFKDLRFYTDYYSDEENNYN